MSWCVILSQLFSFDFLSGPASFALEFLAPSIVGVATSFHTCFECSTIRFEQQQLFIMAIIVG